MIRGLCSLDSVAQNGRELEMANQFARFRFPKGDASRIGRVSLYSVDT
jgi:hypothetical protein